MNREERIQILKMIESGKITADEGLKLMEAIDTNESTTSNPETTSTGKTSKKRLRVQVYENDLNKPKVNISIPLGLAKVISKFVPASATANMNVNGTSVNLDEIVELIKDSSEGKILEVDDEEKKERVVICVE